MQNPSSKIEPWYRQNSMHCIAWTANEITRHRQLIDKDELWYEDVTDDRGEAEAIAHLANGGGAAFFDVEKVNTLKFKNIFKADDENDKNEDDTIESVERDSLLHESFIEEAKNTIEKRMIDLEESNTNEDLPNSEDDDEENLNAENYHRKIFEELQCNFFRPSLNHNNLKIFRQEREKLKAPKRAQDA